MKKLFPQQSTTQSLRTLTFFTHHPDEPHKALYLRLVLLFWFVAFSLVMWLCKPALRWNVWHPYRRIAAISTVALTLLWVAVPRLRGWLRRPNSENIVLLFSSVVICVIGIQLFMTTGFSRRYVLGAWPDFKIIPELAVKANSVGMRDIEHEADKPPGTLRILLLGDSITAGNAVSDTAYYPALLREMAPANVEIIVVAREGWSTWDQYYGYQTIGRCFSPDLVVVGVVTNDLEPPRPELIANLEQLSLEPEIENLYQEAPTAGTQDEWVFFANILPIDISYLMDYILNRVASVLNLRQSYLRLETSLYTDENLAPPTEISQTSDDDTPIESQTSTDSDTAQTPEAFWREGVQLLHTAIEEDQAEAFAFILPSPRRYSDPELYETTLVENNILADGFAEAGFTTLDLFPEYFDVFGDRPYRSLWALPSDGHPGEELHVFFAESIWATIAPTVESMTPATTPVPSPCSSLP